MHDEVVDLVRLQLLIEPVRRLQSPKLTNPRRKRSNKTEWAACDCDCRLFHRFTSDRAWQERCPKCGAELKYGSFDAALTSSRS